MSDYEKKKKAQKILNRRKELNNFEHRRGIHLF